MDQWPDGAIYEAESVSTPTKFASSLDLANLKNETLNGAPSGSAALRIASSKSK